MWGDGGTLLRAHPPPTFRPLSAHPPAQLLSTEVNTLVIFTARKFQLDTTPPVITLLGEPSVRVAQFSR